MVERKGMERSRLRNPSLSQLEAQFSFSYSALACFRMRTSGSVSLRQPHTAQQVGVAWVGADTIKDWISLDPFQFVVSHLIGFL